MSADIDLINGGFQERLLRQRQPTTGLLPSHLLNTARRHSGKPFGAKRLWITAIHTEPVSRRRIVAEVASEIV